MVGRGRALEPPLTGRRAADEAFRIGLVNRVVPAVELATEVRTLAQAIAAKAPVAVDTSSTRSRVASRCRWPTRQDYEATLFGLVSTTEDMREGTKAFLEKRKPDFKGR